MIRVCWSIFIGTFWVFWKVGEIQLFASRSSARKLGALRSPTMQVSDDSGWPMAIWIRWPLCTSPSMYPCICWLVVWLPCFIFPLILGCFHHPNWLIFFRGVFPGPPTSICLWCESHSFLFYFSAQCHQAHQPNGLIGQVEQAMGRKHHVGAAVAPQRCCLAFVEAWSILKGCEVKESSEGPKRIHFQVFISFHPVLSSEFSSHPMFITVYPIFRSFHSIFFPFSSKVGNCPNWTSPDYWGYFISNRYGCFGDVWNANPQ